ncbi:MAG: nitrate/nitrite transporter NrtS [Sulfurimonas sp.]|nr:nitrate/nitrite transporter NrtS [Sulfurimonas sp.]
MINSRIKIISIEHFKIYCKIAVSPNIINRALKVSFIVGTALNLINQWGALTTIDFENINLTKFMLTYLVPYSVTTYTATVMKVEFQIGTKAIVEAYLKCTKCGEEIHVHKDELIPECSKCGLNTHWKLI